jgi:hypothetical protein
VCRLPHSFEIPLKITSKQFLGSSTPTGPRLPRQRGDELDDDALPAEDSAVQQMGSYGTIALCDRTGTHAFRGLWTGSVTCRLPHPDNMPKPGYFDLFLALPRELRYHVYEDLLQPHDLRIRSYDHQANQPDLTTIPAEAAATTHFFHRHSTGPERKRLYPSILQASHQVHDEAKPFLYRPTALVLSPSQGDPEMEVVPTDRLFDLNKLHYISRLPILQVNIITVPETWAEDIAHNVIALSYLKNAARTGDLSIGTLEVDIHEMSRPRHGIAYQESVFADLRKLMEVWVDVGTPRRVVVRLDDKDGNKALKWRRNESGEWSAVGKPYAGYDAQRRERYFHVAKEIFAKKTWTE